MAIDELSAPLSRQQRRAAARSGEAPVGPTAEERVFGLLSEGQQRTRLYAALVETREAAIETRLSVHEAVEAAFAAKWDAKFRELDDLRNDLARRLTRARLASEAELREMARG